VLIALLIYYCTLPLDLSELPPDVRWTFEHYIKTPSKWIRRDKSKLLFVRTLRMGSKSYEKVASLFYDKLYGSVGQNQLKIKAVHCLFNSTLITQFISFMKLTASRYRSDPGIFRDTKWKLNDPGNKRGFVYRKFQDLVKRYEWNDENRIEQGISIIAAVHGTGLQIAWSVADKGFVAISKLDAGFYGKGIYFTSYALYSFPYISSCKKPAILITYVLPGEPYPVIEGHTKGQNFLGKGLRGAAICHYVVTDRTGMIGTENNEDLYDELVFAQESALLPAFIIELDSSNFRSLMKTYQRVLCESEEAVTDTPDDKDNEKSTREFPKLDLDEDDKGKTNRNFPHSIDDDNRAFPYEIDGEYTDPSVSIQIGSANTAVCSNIHGN